MTETEKPKRKHSHYAHGSKCVRPSMIDMETMAEIIAGAFGSTEPVEWDFELANKLYEYVQTCSPWRQAPLLRKTGMTIQDISAQLGMSATAVRVALEENPDGAPA